MTKLAILADIHGNLPALEAVLDSLANEAIDRIVVAGDLINWGPFSAQVVERATRERWAVIRGNNEYYLLDHGTPRAPATWSDRGQYPLLPWLQRQLVGQWQTAIAVWPDTLSLRFADAPPIRVVHGTPNSPWEPIYPDLADDALCALLAGVDEPTVIAGHTHLPLDRTVDRWRLLNPGSVGLPLDGIPEAQFLILESREQTWHPTFRRVSYDRAPLFEEFERQRFRDECGVVGELAIEEFRTARLQLHPFVVWRSHYCPERPVSEELLEEFRKVDPRPFAPAPYWD